jgi:RNA polymerase sigma-70 factor (ECF subfamily)
MRVEGYSFFEIAQKHGISESSARVIDHRAKRKIREALAKEGIVHE